MQRLFAEMRAVQYNRGRGGNGQRKLGAVAPDNPFIVHLQTIANRQADFAELLAYSGCRHEEAATLKVENIDKNAPGFLYVDGTKSKQAKRDVPIFTPLRTILDRVSKGKKPGDLLFPSIKVRNRNGAVGDQRNAPFNCLQALKRACIRLGIRPLVQHELRHYFATKMVEENCTWSQLAEWLGQADGGILAAETYSHIRKSHQRSEADRINVAFTTRL